MLTRTYSVSARLSHNPQRNFTELVTDIDGNISKQRVLVNQESVTLYTKVTTNHSSESS